MKELRSHGRVRIDVPEELASHVLLAHRLRLKS